MPSPMLIANLIENKRKLLQRRDDNLFAAFDESPQVASPLWMTYNRFYLGKPANRVANLLIQYAPVGYNDDGVKDGLTVSG